MNYRHDATVVPVHNGIERAIELLNVRMGVSGTFRQLKTRALFPARTARLKAKREKVTRQRLKIKRKFRNSLL
jgi:ribosomal protein S21